MAITEAQRVARRGVIGSSDVAAVMGCSPYATPYDLWLEKTGQVDPDDDVGVYAKIGTAIEEGIVSFAAETLGVAPLFPSHSDENPDGPEAGTFAAGPIRVHLDGMVAEDGATSMCEGLPIIEAKYTGVDEGWGDDGTDEVPEHVLCQVMAQMIAAGSSVAHIGRLPRGDKYGDPFRVYTVEYERDLADIIQARVAHFMRLVETRTPPKITDKAPDEGLLAKIARKAGSVRSIDPQLAAEYIVAREEASKAEERKKIASAKIKAALGDAEVGDVAGFSVSFKETKPTARQISKDNLARLKKDHPEIFEEYTDVRSSYRTLRVARLSPKKKAAKKTAKESAADS
jgi:putative phage-type endonuclease